jgi:hypothetical protein
VLIFLKEDLPSGKKGGKTKMLFIWIDPKSEVYSFDGFQERPS